MSVFVSVVMSVSVSLSDISDWSAVEKHICMSTSKSVSVSLSVFVSACI